MRETGSALLISTLLDSFCYHNHSFHSFVRSFIHSPSHQTATFTLPLLSLYHFTLYSLFRPPSFLSALIPIHHSPCLLSRTQMPRRTSYEAIRESVDINGEDASFLTDALPQDEYSHRSQQKASDSNHYNHDEDEYEYGHGHLREQHSSQHVSSSTTATATSDRLVSGQRGATTTKTSTTTTTITTSRSAPVNEISALTLAAIDPLSLPATHPEVVSSSSPVFTKLQQQQQEPTYSKWNTIMHQLSFIGSGIFSTIGVQWLYYQGGACKLHLSHYLFKDNCSLSFTVGCFYCHFHHGPCSLRWPEPTYTNLVFLFFSLSSDFYTMQM